MVSSSSSEMSWVVSALLFLQQSPVPVEPSMEVWGRQLSSTSRLLTNGSVILVVVEREERELRFVLRVSSAEDVAAAAAAETDRKF